MDWFSPEILSRTQFGLAAFFIFLFVPLTLGLSLLVAGLQTLHLRRGGAVYLRAAQFWGRILLISFSLTGLGGLVCGLLLGAGWPRFLTYAGGVIGPLIFSGALSFSLQATGLLFWRYGRKKLGEKAHLASIWLAALAGHLTLLWLIQAYAWLQNPGLNTVFAEVAGRAELLDFTALLANPCAWGQFLHTLFAAWCLSGFFVLGVAALRLLCKRRGEADFSGQSPLAVQTANQPLAAQAGDQAQAVQLEAEADREIFRRSASLAASFTLAATFCLAISGHWQVQNAARLQPAKLAALAAHWESRENAPFYLLAWPVTDSSHKNGGYNRLEALPLPGGLDFWAAAEPAESPEPADPASPAESASPTAPAEMADPASPAESASPTAPAEMAAPANPVETAPGLGAFDPEARPPALTSALAFRLMLLLGGFLLLLSIATAVFRNKLQQQRRFCLLLACSLPLPHLALFTGWLLAEAGRQPWVIHQIMRSAEAAPPLGSAASAAASPLAAAFSLVVFALVCGGLALTALFLIYRAVTANLQLRRPETAATAQPDQAGPA